MLNISQILKIPNKNLRVGILIKSHVQWSFICKTTRTLPYHPWTCASICLRFSRISFVYFAKHQNKTRTNTHIHTYYIVNHRLPIRACHALVPALKSRVRSRIRIRRKKNDVCHFLYEQMFPLTLCHRVRTRSIRCTPKPPPSRRCRR